MGKRRLEAFSDGVIAIIITIMVLELKVPRGSDLAALKPLVPAFSSYILSFGFLAIYWNNHHHMLHAAERVDARILWANMHLLFWLSLIPVSTAWIGAHHAESAPTALYGAILFMAAIGYYLLERAIIALHGKESVLARAIGPEVKGLLSVALYLAAVGLAFVKPWLSDLIYLAVAIIWLIPDRRIERALRARTD